MTDDWKLCWNSDSVQIQYVQYLGAMTQKLVETYVM